MQSHRVIIDLALSLATPNSSGRLRKKALFSVLFCGVLLLISSLQLRAQKTDTASSAVPLNPVKEAETALQLADKLWHGSPTNVQLAINVARLSFDFADITTEKKMRSDVASRAIQACEDALIRFPQSVGLHYYLAMNAGQLARTKSLGALKLVDRMEEEFHRALDLDANYDFAGPDRNLGLLYRDAPGWPASIGNRKKSIQHLRQAFQLHPEYPDNILNLAETYAHWGEKTVAEDYFRRYKSSLRAAQEQFRGPQWQSSWEDWNSRVAILEHKIPSVITNNSPPKKLH